MSDKLKVIGKILLVFFIGVICGVILFSKYGVIAYKPVYVVKQYNKNSKIFTRDWLGDRVIIFADFKYE